MSFREFSCNYTLFFFTCRAHCAHFWEICSFYSTSALEFSYKQLIWVPVIVRKSELPPHVKTSGCLSTWLTFRVLLWHDPRMLVSQDEQLWGPSLPFLFCGEPDSASHSESSSLPLWRSIPCIWYDSQIYLCFCFFLNHISKYFCLGNHLNLRTSASSGLWVCIQAGWVCVPVKLYAACQRQTLRLPLSWCTGLWFGCTQQGLSESCEAEYMAILQ